MLGDEAGLDALDEPGQSLEMCRVDAVGTPERETDAVDRDGGVTAYRVQPARRGPPAHVVLGMHLEPAHGGAGGEPPPGSRAPEPPAPLRGAAAPPPGHRGPARPGL